MYQTRKSKCLVTPRRSRIMGCNHITVPDIFLTSGRNFAGNQRIVNKVFGWTIPAIRHWHHLARYYVPTYFWWKLLIYFTMGLNKLIMGKGELWDDRGGTVVPVVACVHFADDVMLCRGEVIPLWHVVNSQRALSPASYDGYSHTLDLFLVRHL